MKERVAFLTSLSPTHAINRTLPKDGFFISITSSLIALWREEATHYGSSRSCCWWWIFISCLILFPLPSPHPDLLFFFNIKNILTHLRHVDCDTHHSIRILTAWTTELNNFTARQSIRSQRIICGMLSSGWESCGAEIIVRAKRKFRDIVTWLRFLEPKCNYRQQVLIMSLPLLKT